jgi:hypothetical protein
VLTVTPNTVVVDGQAVLLEGSGFLPDWDMVVFGQCVGGRCRGPLRRRTGALGFSTTSNPGDYEATRYQRQPLVPNPETIEVEVTPTNRVA